jgi:hypothetical protein
MKKRLFVMIGALLFLAFILFATLVKRVFKTEVALKTDVRKIQAQLGNTEKVAKWFMPFSESGINNDVAISKTSISSGENSLQIVNQQSFSCLYKLSNNKENANVVVNIIPDTSMYAHINIKYENTLWNQLFRRNALVENAKKSIYNFKEYMEDTKKMYGYKIQIEQVADTSFLYNTKIVLKKDKKATFKNLFEKLINEANEKKYGYTGVRIFYTSPVGEDSIQLFNSIGISNKPAADFVGDFSIKNMPFKKHLLTAFYQGSYGGVFKAIDALELFKSENNLNSMAIPFVKIITEGIDFDEDQIIQAKVCYPIM